MQDRQNLIFAGPNVGPKFLVNSGKNCLFVQQIIAKKPQEQQKIAVPKCLYS